MPTIKSFTPANVRTLPAGEWREQVDSGLVLRVQGSTRSYTVSYTLHGKARRILLGHVGEVELGPASDRDLSSACATESQRSSKSSWLMARAAIVRPSAVASPCSTTRATFEP